MKRLKNNHTHYQMRLIEILLGLKFARPYPKNYRRPADTEEQLKKT
jgi:hypothetical protein